MKLFELMRQIQDACLNDGNLEKEVVIFDTDTGLNSKPIAISSEQPGQITIFVE